MPALLAGDEVNDTTVFGPLGSADATPQYELARILTEERDRFVQGWRQTEANQLGLGDAEVIDNQFVSTNPRAAGADLDLLLEQYGVPRPLGFTDCCYWRLYELLLWQPGNPAWLLKEIAELYTGVRPLAIESRSKIILQWPSSAVLQLRGGTFTDFDAFTNRTAVAGGDQPGPSTVYSLYAADGPANLYGDGFVGDTVLTSPGLTLEQALAIAKPWGVAVQLVGAPIAGSCGCMGATTRGTLTGYFVGAAPEDV